MIRPAAKVAAATAMLSALALPASAISEPGAQLRVSAASELSEGQRITVDGSGFRPGLAAVAVGLCKQGFTNGLQDCDLDGGATFVNISGDGTFRTVTLTAHPRFNEIDCAQQPCVIAAAPLPGTEPPAIIAANSVEVVVGFAGSRPPAPMAAPNPAVRVDTDIQGPSTALWAATAALLLIVAGATLINRRRL